MQCVYSGPFEYPNLGWGMTTCHLQVYHHSGEPLVAIATELPTNDGTSITNAIERIADGIRQQLRVAHEDLILIEHQLPRSTYRDGRRDCPEEFSRVRFDIRGGQFRRPRWTYMPRADLEQLIGQPFAVNIE